MTSNFSRFQRIQIQTNAAKLKGCESTKKDYFSLVF